MTEYIVMNRYSWIRIGKLVRASAKMYRVVEVAVTAEGKLEDQSSHLWPKKFCLRMEDHHPEFQKVKGILAEISRWRTHYAQRRHELDTAEKLILEPLEEQVLAIAEKISLERRATLAAVIRDKTVKMVLDEQSREAL